MVQTILPGQTIGIIGGGKAARLLALKAQEMGYYVGVLAKNRHYPAVRVADWWMEHRPNEPAVLLELAEKSAVLAFVAEELDMDVLSSLLPYIQLPQFSESLSITQDRLIEKVFLESLNINVLPYATITTLVDIQEAVQSIGYPCVLKPIRVEPNQPKNLFLYSEADFHKAEKLLATGACLLESWIPFEKEMAVTFIVDGNQTVTSFPIVETCHQDGVLKRTVLPAPVEADMRDAMKEIGERIARAMEIVGIVTIELFVTSVGMIYVKRISTQPHAATDYSLDLCNLSQYEALIRAITGRAVPEITCSDPSITYYVDASKMKQVVAALPEHPEWCVRFYSHTAADEAGLVGQVTVRATEVDEFFTE